MCPFCLGLYEEERILYVFYYYFRVHSLHFKGERAAKNLISQADNKIQSYMDAFQDLLGDIQGNATLLTEVNVLQIKFITLKLEDKLEDIGKIII